MEEEKKYWRVLGIDGLRFLIDDGEKYRLVQGDERFIWIKEQQIFITKDYIIKIEELYI